MNQPDYFVKKVDAEPDDSHGQPRVTVSVHCILNPASIPMTATIFPSLLTPEKMEDTATFLLSVEQAKELMQKLSDAIPDV